MAAYENIDAYIAQFPDDIQKVLRMVRQTIRENAPDASEKISYGMPCFHQGENLIYFAAMKGHLGIYPTSSGMVKFADQMTAYKTSKGAVQIPWGVPVPYALIANMTQFRVTEATNCMNQNTYSFDAVICKTDGQDGAYIALPFDIREKFGKGRVAVHATFDGVPYDGSAVNMGVKNLDGSICYIIGIRKDIRTRIGKQPGDTVYVTIRERNTKER